MKIDVLDTLYQYISMLNELINYQIIITVIAELVGVMDSKSNY